MTGPPTTGGGASGAVSVLNFPAPRSRRRCPSRCHRPPGTLPPPGKLPAGEVAPPGNSPVPPRPFWVPTLARVKVGIEITTCSPALKPDVIWVSPFAWSPVVTRRVDLFEPDTTVTVDCPLSFETARVGTCTAFLISFWVIATVAVAPP